MRPANERPPFLSLMPCAKVSPRAAVISVLARQSTCAKSEWNAKNIIYSIIFCAVVGAYQFACTVLYAPCPLVAAADPFVSDFKNKTKMMWGRVRLLLRLRDRRL